MLRIVRGALPTLLALCFAAAPGAERAGIEYRSPSCGPAGGSTPWACGPWPTSTPPPLGRDGTTTVDPDTGNRVLRVTRPGSFGEGKRVAFKVLDAGWKPAWNADQTRFLVMPWGGQVRNNAYWVGFDPSAMALTGQSGTIPSDLRDLQWDRSDPDLVVGLSDRAAEAYNVRTKKFTRVFDPYSVRWRAGPWISGWGGNRVCIAEGPQDKGFRLICYDRAKSEAQKIDLHAQTIDDRPLPVTFRGNPVQLPPSIGVHTITMAPDGKWLAIDTHGNARCNVEGLPHYADTGIFLNLDTKEAFEWNIACGATHWAYGYDGVMMQSATPKWTANGADSPCNSDSRGIARRLTDATIDSSYTTLSPCAFFNPATWGVNVHLSWANNANDANVNRYPVLLATISGSGSRTFLGNEIAAMETSVPANQARLWRFAQTWNDGAGEQCAFLEYSSPSISPDGRWALYPSNWRGQTGDDGICKRGTRTDVFVFELK